MRIKSPFRSVSRQKVKKSVKTIWTYARQLFSVSGVNGVSHVALAKTTGRRVLWIIIFTVAVIGWFFQTTTLMEYYYKYPTIVKIEVERETEMEFPALTICNVNKARRSQFCEQFPERCKSKGKSKPSIKLSKGELFNITFDYMKRGNKTLLGHQIEDIIVSCEFSGIPELNTKECIKYFEYLYDPLFGNCIIMASQGRDVLRIKAEDALRDIEEMTLVLNVEEDEYMNTDKDTPGLIFTVHEDMTYPQIRAHGFHVYANHTYSLAVEKITTYLLPSPYNTNCTDYRELSFASFSNLEPTPRICTIECLKHHQHEECGHGYVGDHVVLFADEMPYDPDQATEEDRKCADRLEDEYLHYCSSLCGVPCHDVHFRLNVDSSPTSSQKLLLTETVKKEYERRTYENKTMYLVDVKIHFESMEHRIYRHSPEYTTEELFSYLGGITGGWLGISLLEFVAFCEGMISIFLFSFRYCVPAKRPSRKKKGRRTPRKIVPMYRAEERYGGEGGGGGGECRCKHHQDYGSLLLAVPVSAADSREDSPGTVQVIPFGYY